MSSHSQAEELAERIVLAVLCAVDYDIYKDFADTDEAEDPEYVADVRDVAIRRVVKLLNEW